MNEPLVVRNVKSIMIEDEKNFRDSLSRNSSLSVSNFQSIAINTVMSDPKLYECDPFSIYRCILQTAQLGLNPALQHVYFVPYKKTCTLIIGYKGLLSLAWASSIISSLDSSEVYEGDVYKYVKGTAQSITHEPISEWRRRIKAERVPQKDSYGNSTMRFVSPDAWNHITDVYAWCRLFSGDILVYSMTKEEVNYVRDRFSKAAASGTWTDHYIEMAKKTVVRRLLALLPKGMGDAEKRLNQAITIDRQADAGESQDLPVVVQHTPLPIDQLQISPSDHTVPASVPPGYESHRGKPINDPSIPLPALKEFVKMKMIDVTNPSREQFNEADRAFLNALKAEIESREKRGSS